MGKKGQHASPGGACRGEIRGDHRSQGKGGETAKFGPGKKDKGEKWTNERERAML